MEATMTAARIWPGRAGTFVTLLKNRLFWQEASTEKNEAAPGAQGPGSNTTAACKAPGSPESLPQKMQAGTATPMYFRKGASMATITYADLLTLDSDCLGELWPRLGISKYGLFSGLSEKEQVLIEKKLTMYAYEQADRDFSQGGRWTFETFGRRLKEMPSLSAMDDCTRAKTLYRHYLNFTDQHGVTFSPLTTSFERLLGACNPVEAIEKGKGDCNEIMMTLRHVFHGGGISCTIVETWYMVRHAGMEAHHRALSVGREEDGSPRDIYDPAMYIEAKTRNEDGAPWDRALSWRGWTNHVRTLSARISGRKECNKAP